MNLLHNFSRTVGRLILNRSNEKQSILRISSLAVISLRHQSQQSSPAGAGSKPETSGEERTDNVSVGTHFVNRNPRNLEFMGIAWKRKGWRFQYPSTEFYHRLMLDFSHRHTLAYVEHCTGTRVVTASTRELAISRHLYSMTDVSAAENIGHVLARRCLECGITSMILQPIGISEKSEKLEAFRNAIIAGGIDLTEPEEVVPPYEPGIDYSNPEVVADLERRQQLVYKLGEKSATKKLFKSQQKTRGRRRPKQQPTPLVPPSW